MRPYYNEFDPRKAHALRALGRSGILTPGDVDERSIKLVSGRDVAGYGRVHFFAGIGVWDAALRVVGMLHCFGDAIVLAQAAAAVESLAKALGIWEGSK